jgi:hypothetical protein
MSQEHAIFYLHEDDWGMVSLLPDENLASLHEERDRIDAFSAAHFDGSGWTDIYVRPGESHSITIRQIPYARLVDLFGGCLPAAASVETGYGTYREPCPGCFAFGKTYDIALYGSVQNGTVMQLHLSVEDLPANTALTQALVDALSALGAEYQLVLVDWARSLIVSVANQAAVNQYLSGEPE